MLKVTISSLMAIILLGPGVSLAQTSRVPANVQICHTGSNGYQCQNSRVGPGTPGWVYSAPIPGPQPGTDAYNAAVGLYRGGLSAAGGTIGTAAGGPYAGIAGGMIGGAVGGFSQNRVGAVVTRGIPASARPRCVQGLHISGCVR